MKKFGALLLALIVIVGVYVLSRGEWGEQESDIKMDPASEVFLEDYFNPSLPRDVQRVELFEEIEEGNHQEHQRTLLGKLSEGEDQVAYQSNLLLGDLSPGEEAMGYYLKALDLYKEERGWQRILNIATNPEVEVGEDLILKAAEELIHTPLGMYTYMEHEKDPEKLLHVLAENSLWEDLFHLLTSESSSLEGVDGKDLAYYEVLARIRSEREHQENLIQHLRSYPEDERLLFWKAQMLEEEGHPEEALEIYSSIGTGGAEKAGELYLEMGEEEKAYTLFAESEHPPLMYRGARSFELIGRQDLAVPIYTKLIETEHSLGDQSAYRIITMADYPEFQNLDLSEAKARMESGISWRHRLGEEPHIPIEDEASRQDSEGHKTVRTLERLQALDDHGKTRALQMEIAMMNQQGNLHHRLALAKYYKEKNNHFLSVRQGIALLRERKTHESYLYAYPKPFSEEVLKFAGKYDLDPYLLWAVMREESHFRPDAVSWAGAQGLMQVMPATGEWIGEQIGVSLEEEDLLKPEISIEFGAFYLSNLLRIFEGDLDQALAAYNGGTGNVRRWKDNPIGQSKEGFPIAIAFPETREYIVKVMDSYLIYQWLYEGGEFNGS